MRGNRKSVVALSAAVAGTLLASQSAHAANYVWNALTAGNASGSWSTATNWTPNLPAGGTTTADAANLNTLNITANSTITLDAAQAISVINFGDTDTTTPANWTINATSGTPNDATHILTLPTSTATTGTGSFTPTFNEVGTSATINATVSNGSVNGASGFWGLAKGGNGTLTLTANNSALTGVIFINNGTLSLDFNHAWSPLTNIIGDTSSGSTSASHLEFQSATLNLIGKTGASNSQTFSAGTNAGIGSSSITFTQNGATSLSLGLGAITRGTLAEAGGIVKQPGATIDITLPTSGTVSGTTPGSGPGGLATDANGSPFITINGGSDWAAQSGGNLVAGASVAGFYTPSTSSVLAGNADLVTNTTLTAATSIASLRYNDTTAHTLDLGGQSLTTGGILVTPSSGGALVIQNGTMVGPSTAQADMIISQNNATFPLTISAAIVNSAVNDALTKTGVGTLILTGNNTYSGDTVINGGTLSITAGTLGIVGSPFSCTQVAPAFGNTATMNISGTAVVSDDHFDIAGNENNFAGGTGVLNQTGGTILNAAWFSVGSLGNGTYNFSGGANTVEGGFASFEVGVFGSGVGTVNMSGTAQLSIWNSAVITMSDAGSTGNNTINQNGGTITMYADAGITPGGTGRVVIGGGGGGNDNYNLNGGTLIVPAITRTSTTGTGNLNLNGGTVRATGNSTAFITNLTAINVGAGGAIIDTQTFNDTIKQPLLHATALGATADGGLTKVGSGTLVLGTTAALQTANAFTSTYTGPTKVTAGTIQLPSNAVVPPPTPLAAYSFDSINGAAPTNGTELNPGDVINNSGSGGAALNAAVNTANYNGFGISGVSVVAGKFGHALSFDGAGSSVDVSSNILDMSANATWTMSLWVQTTTPGGEFLAKTTPTTGWDAGASSFYLAANPPSGTPGSFPTAVRNGGGFLQGGTSVTDGTWHLLTYVDDSGTKSIYVDGSTSPLTQTGFNTADTSTGVRIGFNSDTLPTLDGNVPYVGNLDEVDFYSAALTQQQVQDLFANNTITHSTPGTGGQLLPVNTPVNLSASGATLDLNGNNQTIGSLTGVAGTSLLLGAGNLTTGGDNTTTTFAGAISGNGGLAKTGTGTFTMTGTNTYFGNTSVSGGTLVVNSVGALPSGTNLTIGANSTAAINRGAGSRILLQLNSLSIAGTGTLDMANNDMIVHNSNAGTVTTMTTELQQGWNNGTWTGGTGGITSSTAATAAAAHNDITALGIELNDNGSGGTLKSTFDGQTVTNTDVLVKYTYYGDADLSGTVTSADYILIDNGFNSHLTGWHNGDFNYDGVVNGDDYALIDNAYNTQNLGSFAAIGSPAEMVAGNTAQVASSSAVPEPTTLSLLAVAAAGSLGRRRRRSK